MQYTATPLHSVVIYIFIGKSLVKLAALGSDGVVSSQLVSFVYPTHVLVVERDALRARDITCAAIPSLPAHCGGHR